MRTTSNPAIVLVLGGTAGRGRQTLRFRETALAEHVAPQQPDRTAHRATWPRTQLLIGQSPAETQRRGQRGRSADASDAIHKWTVRRFVVMIAFHGFQMAILEAPG